MFSKLFANLPDEKFAKPQLDSDTEPSIDVAAAFQRALAAPLFYPPLGESVFPGDSVALLLQDGIPHPKQLTESILDQLSNTNIESDDVTIVLSARTAKQLGVEPVTFESAQSESETPPPTFELEFGFNKIKCQVHDPENDAGLSYLVANEIGEPVMVNRTLVDADVVIPIACPSAGEVADQVDCVYPDFSSATTQARYQKKKQSFINRRQEIELANDTLGSFFSIQVVCGPGDTIKDVLCGARKDATDSARSATNELWAFNYEGQADVVVATIESEPSDQTWTDFAKAVVAATNASTSVGPIVVWSSIKSKPGTEIKKACASQFEDFDLSKMDPKLQALASILKERPVFLKSGMTRGVVEELGLGFIEEVDQVIRIAEPHGHGLLIRDAHKCQIQMAAAAKQDD